MLGPNSSFPISGQQTGAPCDLRVRCPALNSVAVESRLGECRYAAWPACLAGRRASFKLLLQKLAPHNFYAMGHADFEYTIIFQNSKKVDVVGRLQLIFGQF